MDVVPPAFPTSVPGTSARSGPFPRQGVPSRPELPTACGAGFWALPRNSDTSTLGAQHRVARPGKEVQVAGLGGCCCIVTGLSASWLIRASETQPTWALPSCRARGTQAARCHCPHGQPGLQGHQPLRQQWGPSHTPAHVRTLTLAPTRTCSHTLTRTPPPYSRGGPSGPGIPDGGLACLP